jgi:hypothetical protein
MRTDMLSGLTVRQAVAEYGDDESAIGSAGLAGIGISLQLLNV